MARLNRDMEAAAIVELDPAPSDRVLSVGFGPGVGIKQLSHMFPSALVAGVDPSATMVEIATRRNRSAVDRGRVVLRRAGAEAIPWPDASFDGVVAVNSIQLWEPLTAAVGEVARVLRPGGLLVTVTHAWAVEKIAPVAEWSATVAILLGRCGFGIVTSDTRRFRTGPALVQQVRREMWPLLL